MSTKFRWWFYRVSWRLAVDTRCNGIMTSMFQDMISISVCTWPLFELLWEIIDDIWADSFFFTHFISKYYFSNPWVERLIIGYCIYSKEYFIFNSSSLTVQRIIVASISKKSHIYHALYQHTLIAWKRLFIHTIIKQDSFVPLAFSPTSCNSPRLYSVYIAPLFHSFHSFSFSPSCSSLCSFSFFSRLLTSTVGLSKLSTKWIHAPVVTTAPWSCSPRTGNKTIYVKVHLLFSLKEMNKYALLSSS